MFFSQEKRDKFRNWVNEEVKKELHKIPFTSLPLKMQIGIYIIASSYIIGNLIPYVIIPILAVRLKMPVLTAAIPVFIIGAWPIGIFGIGLAGKDSVKFPIYFFAFFCKKLFPSFFRKKDEFSPEEG